MTCSACKQEKPGTNCAGAKYQCATCGLHLYGKREVRGHWALHSEGHSVFTSTMGRAYHQTGEGLHRREAWDNPRTSLDSTPAK